MKKRGFAISIILYSLVFLLVSIFYVLLAILKTRYTTTKGLRENIIENFNSSNALGDIMSKLCNRSDTEYLDKYNMDNGSVDDVFGQDYSSDICYYNDDKSVLSGEKGNVIFGDYCWKIIRTTSNGGVKLLYNGQKTADGKCPDDNSQRPSSTEIKGSKATTTSLSGSKLYGRGFTYSGNTFTLTNTFIANWNGDYDNDGNVDYPNIIGTYTCKSNSSSCTTLYYVGAYKSETEAHVASYTIGESTHYSQIGTSVFNAFDRSLAQINYMYNDIYYNSSHYIAVTKLLWNNDQVALTSKYFFGDKAVWNSVTNKYDLTINGETPSSLITWEDIRSHVGGMYTCKNSTDTSCDTVYYIVNNYDLSMYTIALSNGKNINDMSMALTYGTGYTENNGNYELTDTATETFLLKDWYSVRDKHKGKYVCSDYTSTKCSKLYYIYNLSMYYYELNSTQYKYYFSNSVSYSNGHYILNTDSDPLKYQSAWEYGRSGYMDKMHYTCLNKDSNECGDTVYYVFYISNALYYYPLKNGDTIETFLEKIINVNKSSTSNVNKYNSAIKSLLENWYEMNFIENGLSKYIDNDAIFCNDRTVSVFNGLSPIGSPRHYINFISEKYNKQNTSLSCNLITDQFSVQNAKAKLKYPIGLLTYAEEVLINYDYLKTGQEWWLMSPAISISDGTLMHVTKNDFSVSHSSGGNSLAVRPVIVLKNNAEVTGEGTYDDPYIVQIDSASN